MVTDHNPDSADLVKAVKEYDSERPNCITSATLLALRGYDPDQRGPLTPETWNAWTEEKKARGDAGDGWCHGERHPRTPVNTGGFNSGNAGDAQKRYVTSGNSSEDQRRIDELSTIGDLKIPLPGADVEAKGGILPAAMATLVQRLPPNHCNQLEETLAALAVTAFLAVMPMPRLMHQGASRCRQSSGPCW